MCYLYKLVPAAKPVRSPVVLRSFPFLDYFSYARIQVFTDLVESLHTFVSMK